MPQHHMTSAFQKTCVYQHFRKLVGKRIIHKCKAKVVYHQHPETQWTSLGLSSYERDSFMMIY